MFSLLPTIASSLHVQHYFLWPIHQQWYCFEVTQTWSDGIVARGVRDTHTETLFLPGHQWVAQVKLRSSATVPPSPRRDSRLGQHLSESLQAQELLKTLWAVPFVGVPAQGPSMLPLSPPGALLEVEPFDRAFLRPGQVLVWARQHQWVCHRLHALHTNPPQPPTLQTWGDALPMPDPPFPLDRLFGRVRFIQYQGQRYSIDTLPQQYLARCKRFVLAQRYRLAKARKRWYTR